MMQEHHQHIKRARTSSGRQLDKPTHIFEKFFGNVAPIFNEVIYEGGTLVYHNGP
jgi:hypothetical protein